ncbi:MAG: biotin transporter BioY [Lachnospiraceae bacterium]|nr:biotin transporter BioY [Lachnospiraceae bacterium]
MENTTRITQKSHLSVRQLTTAGLTTALLCILGPLALAIPVSPVPISLTTLALYFITSIFGMKLSVLSCLTYLLIGAAGLPVFSGFSGGLAKMAGPTGGYLIGFLFLAGISGAFVDHFPGKTWIHVIGMILGTAVCYLFGTVWLAHQLGLSFTAGLGVGVLPYLPGDAAKILLTALIAPAIRRRLPDLSDVRR